MQYNMIFINFLNLKSKILHEIIFSFFRLTIQSTNSNTLHNNNKGIKIPLSPFIHNLTIKSHPKKETRIQILSSDNLRNQEFKIGFEHPHLQTSSRKGIQPLGKTCRKRFHEGWDHQGSQIWGIVRCVRVYCLLHSTWYEFTTKIRVVSRPGSCRKMRGSRLKSVASILSCRENLIVVFRLSLFFFFASSFSLRIIINESIFDHFWMDMWKNFISCNVN